MLGAAVAATALALTGCAAGQQAQTAEQTSVVDGTAFQAGTIDLRDVGLRAPGAAAYAKGSSAFLEGVMINGGRSTDDLVSVSSPQATGVELYSDGVTALIGLAPSPSTRATAADSAGSGSATASGSASSSVSAGGTATGSASTPTAGSTGSAGATATPSPTGSASSSSSAGSSAVKALQSVPIDPNQAVKIGYENSDVQIVLTGLTEDLAPAQTLQITFTFASGATVTANVAVKLPTGVTQTAPSVDTGKQGE